MKLGLEKKLINLGDLVLERGYGSFQLAKALKSGLGKWYSSICDLCDDAVGNSPEAVQSLKSNLDGVSLRLTDSLRNHGREGINQLSELLTEEGFKEVYNASMNSLLSKSSKLKGSLKKLYHHVRGYRPSIRTTAYSLLATYSLLQMFACAGVAKRVPSYPDLHPEVLNRVYTAEEIKRIKRGYKANPTKYKKEREGVAFYEIRQKSDKLAMEVFEIPEIADEVSREELDKFLIPFSNLVEGMNIPSDLFLKKDLPQGTHRVSLVWKGKSNEKGDWSGYFLFMGNNPKYGKFIDVKPIGFEKGEDSINYAELKEHGALEWKSYSNRVDPDGLMLTFTFPKKNDMTFDIKGTSLSFNEKDLMSKGQLYLSGDNLEGSLVVKNVPLNTLPQELYAIKDMVLAGEGEYRSSPALRALCEGHRNGKLKEGDNPLKDYQGVAELVMSVLNDMKGKEFDDYEYTRSWMGDPRVFSAYINKNYTKIIVPQSNSHSVYGVFNSKEAWCAEMGEMGIDMVNPHGFNGYLYWDLSWPKQSYAGPLVVSGHTVAAYEQDELMHIFVDWAPGGNRMYSMTKNEFNKRFQRRIEPLPGW